MKHGCLIFIDIFRWLYPVITGYLINPITVSPNKIIIDPPKPLKKFDGKVAEFPFSIINKREQYYSNIWVKLIWQIPKEFRDAKFEIEPQSIDLNKTIDAGDMLICLNIFQINGFDDLGKACTWLFLHSIKPNESILFLLRLKNIGSISRGDSQAVIFLKCIKKPNKEPLAFVSDTNLSGGTAYTQLKPPENMNRTTWPKALTARKLNKKIFKMPKMKNKSNKFLLPKK